MHPIDQRINELMTRLRLPRRVAECRAYVEAAHEINRCEAAMAAEPGYGNRQRDYGLAA